MLFTLKTLLTLKTPLKKTCMLLAPSVTQATTLLEGEQDWLL